ncbi:MAG: hypothetical protein IJS74_03520 [Clostridia bacterium]|nr:hypothetical protein [Clostridia bacterium]
MKRENLAKTVTVILSTLLFIVIGSCFSAFLYKYEMVEVENPKVFLSDDMQLFNADGDKVIDELSFSKMSLGLKPTTGEEDAETNIPITVNDRQGSEGVYAKCNIFAPSGATVKLKNIKFDATENQDKIEQERDNVFVAVKEIDESAVSLENGEAFLGTLPASDEKQLCTFYVWLSAKTGDVFKAVKISFDIYFENIEE